MNPRIVISLGVFVVGFGLGYGATYMLVGGSSDTEATETTPPTASISSGVSVAETANGDSAKQAPVPKKLVAPEAQAAEPPKAKKLAKEPVVKEAPEPLAKPVPTEKAKPWWEVCLGKKCAVDFGGIKTGLSIRSGSITHKQTIDWNLRFKKAKRLNILPTDRRVKVQLVAVGFDGKGKPAAAQVKCSDKGTSVSGVISLQPGDKRVKLLANTAE